LKGCEDDDGFREALLSEAVFDVLDMIGYRGIVTRETLSSRDDIIR
jgi:hypothetical protein